MTEKFLLYVFLIICIAMFYTFVKSKRFMKCLCFSVITGLSSLFLIHAIGLYTFPLIELNTLSVSISSVLGIPGVISLLMINLL